MSQKLIADRKIKLNDGLIMNKLLIIKWWTQPMKWQLLY